MNQQIARTMFDQIGTWTLIRVGTRNRMHGENFIQFEMSMERRKRTCIVELTGDDLYSVSVGRFSRRTLEWTNLYAAEGIQAENLSQTIEDAFVHVMS